MLPTWTSCMYLPHLKVRGLSLRGYAAAGAAIEGAGHEQVSQVRRPGCTSGNDCGGGRRHGRRGAVYGRDREHAGRHHEAGQGSRGAPDGCGSVTKLARAASTLTWSLGGGGTMAEGIIGVVRRRGVACRAAIASSARQAVSFMRQNLRGASLIKLKAPTALSPRKSGRNERAGGRDCIGYLSLPSWSRSSNAGRVGDRFGDAPIAGRETSGRAWRSRAPESAPCSSRQDQTMSRSVCTISTAGSRALSQSAASQQWISCASCQTLASWRCCVRFERRDAAAVATLLTCNSCNEDIERGCRWLDVQVSVAIPRLGANFRCRGVDQVRAPWKSRQRRASPPAGVGRSFFQPREIRYRVGQRLHRLSWDGHRKCGSGSSGSTRAPSAWHRPNARWTPQVDRRQAGSRSRDRCGLCGA